MNTSIEYPIISKVLPATNKMCALPPPFPDTGIQTKSSAEADKQIVTASGALAKSLNKLTLIVERGIDRQVMAAQIRAYDTPTHSPSKPGQW